MRPDPGQTQLGRSRTGFPGVGGPRFRPSETVRSSAPAAARRRTRARRRGSECSSRPAAGRRRRHTAPEAPATTTVHRADRSARASTTSAACPRSGRSVWASCTTVPCASRGWRNASFHPGRRAEMPTGVYPEVRNRSSDLGEVHDLVREVVRPLAVPGDEARQEVEAADAERLEQLDGHAVVGWAEPHLVGPEPDLLAAHEHRAAELADEEVGARRPRRGSRARRDGDRRRPT